MHYQELILHSLPPETSQDTSTETPAAYGPIVVEASTPDSSTMTGRLGGTKKIKKGVFTVCANRQRIKLYDHYVISCLYKNHAK